MKDGGSEGSGELASGWPWFVVFADEMSDKEACDDDDDDAVCDLIVWLLWL